MSLNRSFAILCVAFTSFVRAQAPEADETVIRSSVREVLLDVVVRQKNMQLARKLNASDFTVKEDGVPQKIKTFRLVTGKDSDTAPELVETGVAEGEHASAIAPVRKIEQPGFVSIVFEQMSPGTRKYAQDAVQAFLKHELRSSTYVAIFSLDYRMDVLQSFTNNRALLARAVERAVLSTSSSLSRENAKVVNQADYEATGGPGGVNITSSVDLAKTAELATAGADIAITEGAQAAAKIVADQREIAMYQGGMRTVVALMNLVKYEAALPGRKTVIYVSEGLNLPPGQHELIRDVISSANRSNVSFYGIDVRGLSTSNANSLARNLGRSAARASASQQSRPSTINEHQAKEADQILEMNVGNTDLNMEELAKGTGGFAVADTNDFAKAMVRVMQDVRTHYEIAYTPTSDVYDGHFRTIKVAVDKPAFTVQSREGYYALPDLNGQAIQPFEMAALSALNAKPPVHTFDFRMAALRFRPAQTGYHYEIAFEVPIANLTPRVKPDQKTARLHATFLALIKDPGGQVIDKVSREIDRDVPQEKLDQFRQGRIIFTTPVALRPGHYTMEGVAVDAEGNRASTKRAALVVSESGPVALSDIALVHDLQPLSAPRDPGDPLEFTGGKVTPELDGSLRLAESASVYFVIYPGPGSSRPKVKIQFFRDGAEVASSEPEVNEPDEVNSIPVIASAKLPVGDYQAQVTVQQEGKLVRRSTAFTVAP